MPTFGSIAPGANDEDELLSRYYDPGTGMPVGGTDKYAPRAPQAARPPPGNFPFDPVTARLGRMAKGVLYDAPKALIDTAATTPYGLRREDVTDIPADYTPDPSSPTRGYLPRVAAQPIDPLVGQAVQTASSMIGAPAIGPAEQGAVLGSSALRRGIRNTAMKQATQKAMTGAAPEAAEAAEEAPRAPGIGHNMPPPEEQLSPRDIAYPPPAPVADRSKYIDVRTGLPIQNAGYTKEARRILDEINAGPKGAGPIDLTKTSQVKVPQTMLPRYDPPQGISDRLQDAFNNPNVLDGLRAGIKRGIEMGAHRWYDSAEPVRAAFIDELGPVEGDKAFKSYIDNVAATSPRSDVPTNVRNASYYFGHATPADLPEKLPYPYGHMAQKLHRQNFETITSGGGWEPLQNPKPASFSQNLQGNYEPVTVDTHAFRAIGMRTEDPRFLETTVSAKYKMGTDPDKDTIVNKYGERKGDTVTFRPQKLYADGKLSMEDAKKIPYFWAAVPRDNEYAAAEDLYRYLGDEHGITPAAAQGAGWAGSGELTGLGTVPDKTFGEMLNERILFTAKMRGEDPRQTLKDFIRKKKPLLSTAIGAGAAGAAAAGMGRQGGEERQ